MSGGGKRVNLCQINAYLPTAEYDATLQILRDYFGEPVKLHQRYTHYKASREMSYNASGIRVEEPFDNAADPNKATHVVTALGEHVIVENVGCAFTQSAVISHVTGNAHAFFSSLRYEPTHTWIEYGSRFQRDKITIKIFRVHRYDGSELDPTSFGVAFEALADTMPVQTQTMCKEMATLFRTLLPSAPFAKPQIRGIKM